METFLNMSDGAQANELTEEQKLAEVKRFFKHYNAVLTDGTMTDDYLENSDNSKSETQAQSDGNSESDYSEYNYYLKDFFGLATDDDTLEHYRELQDSYIHPPEEFINYDQVFSFFNDDNQVYLEDGQVIYYDDVKVLLIQEYPVYTAFKIGETIHDSIFIGCSCYNNDIFKKISYYLETGETDVII